MYLYLYISELIHFCFYFVFGLFFKFNFFKFKKQIFENPTKKKKHFFERVSENKKKM